MTRRFLYFLFRLGLRLKDLVLRRFTTAGRIALAGLAVTAVFGIDTNRTMAFQAFTLLFCLLVVALILGRSFKARFTVQRNLPRFATAGEPFVYRLSVSNRTGRLWKDIVLAEDTSRLCPTFEELFHAREPGEQERNAFDRAIGYHRWMHLVYQKRGSLPGPAYLPLLPPGGQAETNVEVRPIRRGPLRLDKMLVSRADPFGLVKGFCRVPAPGSVTVLPKRYPAPQLDLPGNRHHQPGGVSLASSVGDSEEFVSLRDYRPGDPLRRIHWKSWAKTGRPIVKEHQNEFFVRHALVLDTFRGETSEPVFEEAVSVASSFASSVMTQESLLDLLFIGDEAYVFTAGRGLSHTDTMLEILASVNYCMDKPFSTLPPLVLRRSGMLSACIIVFIDWDEEREAFVRELQARGLPLLTLVVAEKAGETEGKPPGFHWLEVGRIEEGLAGIGGEG